MSLTGILSKRYSGKHQTTSTLSVSSTGCFAASFSLKVKFQGDKHPWKPTGLEANVTPPAEKQSFPPCFQAGSEIRIEEVTFSQEVGGRMT